MLNKIYILIIALLIASTPLFANNVIEVGDTISIHITDNTYTDLITGTPTEEVASGGDPHNFVVGDSGEIYIVGIGAIKVAGKTSLEVKELLKNIFYKKKT